MNKNALVQNSGRSEKKYRGRPFPPGTSGNPGGRPKGIMQLVRELTGDGSELVEFMLRLFRGQIKSSHLSDRIDACKWLADRGFGKSLPTIMEPEKPNIHMAIVEMIQELNAEKERESRSMTSENE